MPSITVVIPALDDAEMLSRSLADLARQLRPGLPVVFSSGYALDTLVEKGLASARSIVLTKPYRKAELAHRLREALTATSLASGS